MCVCLYICVCVCVHVCVDAGWRLAQELYLPGCGSCGLHQCEVLSTGCVSHVKCVVLFSAGSDALTLIFVETKKSCDALDNFLYHDGYQTSCIHGDRSQGDTLRSFGSGQTPLMVGTVVSDVVVILSAAFGWHI